VTFFALHYPSGGIDFACAACIVGAVAEDPACDVLRLTRPSDDTYCAWCAAEAGRWAGEGGA
jgi:hypothetical protein